MPVTDETTVLALWDRGAREEAITLLLRQLGPEVRSFLRGTLGDETEAQETYAEAVAELWSSLGTFRRECALRTWWYRIAWHAALRRRHDRFRRRARALDGHEDDLVAEARATTARYLRTDLKAGVRSLRAQLDPDDQALLTLRVDRSLSWVEVASVLGVQEPAARKRFERIKDRLRRAAIEEGLLGDDRR